MNVEMKILFFLKTIVLAQLVPQEVCIHVSVALGVHAFAQFVSYIKQVRTILHAFKTVENGEAVNPLREFREPGVFKTVLATGL